MGIRENLKMIRDKFKPKRTVEVPGRHNNPEVLLNNHLDKELQRFLKPLNLLQNLFLLPKYNISDNFITPNDRKSKVKSLCVGLLMIIIIFYHNVILINDNKQTGFNTTVILIYCLNSILYAANWIFTEIQSIFYSDENVQVVVLIEEIYKLLKGEDVRLKKLILWNWIYFGILFLTTCIVFISLHMYYMYFDIYDIFCDTVIAFLHLNLIYTVRIIRLLKIFLQKIIHEIESFNNDNNTDEVDCHHIYLKCKKIISVYNIHSKGFQPLVSYLPPLKQKAANISNKEL